MNIRPTTGSGLTSKAPQVILGVGSTNKRFYKIRTATRSRLIAPCFLNPFIPSGRESQKHSPSDHPAALSQLFIQVAQIQ